MGFLAALPGFLMSAQGLSLAVGVGTTLMQASQARKAARAQREGQAISTASQQVQDRAAQRRAIRESRIRAAMIQQGAVNQGSSGSSGELGALGALGSNTASAIANQTSQRLAAEGITAANQRAADAESSFQKIGAYGKLFQQGIGLYSSWQKGEL